ncbi:ATP-binding protein [Bifidobacterium bifidum]|uniref:sensor histidine kinase n=1 Tax=Bifidobacterium bifidum TaxID=1681 RepID=UPI0030CA54FC
MPGGRGVRRLRGRVRVPQGQGHAPNPRLGEGAPQPRAITCTVQAGENHTIITIDNTTRPPENAADAEDLIQPFHRGDDTRMANRPGHGLGLSIAKACTDAMQATLAVSRPSPGTFRAEIKLPNRPTQRHCPQQKEHGHRPHARQ